MPFNSFAFLLVFLPIVVIGTNLLRDHCSARAAQIWVLVASLVGYGWGRPADLVLLLASIGINTLIGRRIASTPAVDIVRRRWLQLGLVVNIGFLCLFKYALFLAPWMASVHVIVALSGAIPLGVSFYTLMQIMYLIDCYDDVTPGNSVLQHASYISFFSHLTAGPIDQPKLLMPQLPLLASPETRWTTTSRGLVLLAIGLVKKAVIADAFAHVANDGYGALPSLSMVQAWATSLSYSLQIYFDFSGYTDMALGSALLLGISLTRNFNAPYRATSIGEFWRRWHISLSAFIMTYLYIPMMRGFRRITIHTAAAVTVLTMAIVGLWHGAAWTFVLFGLMHGVALAVHQYWKRLKRPLPDPIAWALTLGLVNLAFIAFRAPTVADALAMGRLLLPHHNLLSHVVLHGSRDVAVVAPAMVGAVTALVGPTSDEIASRLEWSAPMVLATSGLLLVGLLFLNSSPALEFVYFRF